MLTCKNLLKNRSLLCKSFDFSLSFYQFVPFAIYTLTHTQLNSHKHHSTDDHAIGKRESKN